MKRFISLAVLCLGMYLTISAVPPDPVPKKTDCEAVLSAAPGTPEAFEFTVAFCDMYVLYGTDVVKATDTPFLVPALVKVDLEPAIKPPNNSSKWRCWSIRRYGTNRTLGTYRQPDMDCGLAQLKLDKLLSCKATSLSLGNC